MFGQPKPWICRQYLRLVCLVRGHWYRPCYEHQYRQRAHCPNGRMTHQRFRYECACCEAPTKWMNKAQHEVFLDKHNPTWGPRGSDSQGRITPYEPGQDREIG